MQMHWFVEAVSWKSHKLQQPKFTLSLGKEYSKEAVNLRAMCLFWKRNNPLDRSLDVQIGADQ